MKNVHFLNGKLVDEDNLLISPVDLGYSRGYAVFEFMMTAKGRPFMLDRHIDRLYQSSQSISLKIPWSKKMISEWVLKTLEANKSVHGDKVMRLIISGGPSWTLSPAKTPTIVIIVEPRILCSAEDYANGVQVLLAEFQRYKPEAKTNNYIEAIHQLGSVPNGIDEVIYYSCDTVREGTRSNVFALINGSLVTPKTGVLEGITRGIIINELELSVQVSARDFSVQELLSASEVFITATSKEVMPVTKLNNLPIGDGTVGNITKEVMSKFRSFFNSDLW